MWKKGVGHSRETCDKISNTLKGRKQTPEHIANRANSARGFKQSVRQKETARKIRVKSWMVVAPNGETIIISNLAEFCKRNGLKWSSPIKQAIKANRKYRGFTFKKLG